MTPRSRLVVALALAFVGFTTSPAHAHNMRLKVSVGQEIVAKTTYDGDDHDGGDVTVRVMNANKDVIASGKIGKDGYWRTPAPKEPGKYLVVAEDDFGHRAQQEIEIGTLPPDGKPQEYTANEPPVSSSLAVIIGIAVIGAATLGGYWFLSRKQNVNPTS